MKNLNTHGHRTSVAAEPFVRQDLSDEAQYDCIDGRLSSRDVAKAAGVSGNEAKRAIKARLDITEGARSHGKNGATFTFGCDEVPHPSTVTRAALALIIAERLQIGRFGLKKRIEERKRMATKAHPWRNEVHGRSTKTLQGGLVQATLTCSKCGVTETIQFRQLCDAREMDRKFSQKGWAVDPAKCPVHNPHNHVKKQEKPVSTATAPTPTFAAPTPAAIAAQAKMFGLLQTHFDPESGTYSNGYSDERIAAECRLSVDLVAGVRSQAFGELKVPSEVAALQADIAALEGLLAETIAPIQSELRSLRSRVAECCKKFGG